MRVLGYGRVSTEEQGFSGVSLDCQVEKIRGYCRLYELELVDTVTDVESGKSLERPGIETTVKMLDAGWVDGVVITKLDRLSRSVKDWNSLIDGYFSEKAGKQLFSVGDSIDTRTAAGRLVLNVLMSVAQWEREAIAERTREALAHKRAKGERISKSVFGFDIGRNGKLVPNEGEQAAAVRMREMRAAGSSLREIADEMDRLGVKTKEGRPWAHQSVSRIVARPA